MPNAAAPAAARWTRLGLWIALVGLSLGAGTIVGSTLGLRATRVARAAKPTPREPSLAPTPAPAPATPLYDAAHPAPRLDALPTGQGLFADAR